MNMKIKYYYKYVGILALGAILSLSSCSDTFLQDKKDYTGFNDEIYSNFNMAQASVDYIHRQVQPKVGGVNALSGSTGSADEHSKSTLEYAGSSKFVQLTEVTSNTMDCYFNGSNDPAYNNGVWINIRRCNVFLANIDKGSLSEPEKEILKGQVYFWRAWLYYRLVTTFGGVAIIKEPQNPTLGSGTVEQSTLNTPRSSTEDCITFICEDLDAAAGFLPSIWSDPAVNFGRVTRGAAMALKGRVLLYYASPLFNRSNDKNRWDAAYKANQAAYDELTKFGDRDLVDASTNRAKNWELMFTNATSKEGVLLTLYNDLADDQFRSNNTWEQSARPKDIGGSGGISSTAEMVDMFPMADGKKPSESSHTYDPLKFYKNRDPRFYRTFAFTGVCWPYLGDKGYTLWNYQWYKDKTTAMSGVPGNSSLYMGDVSSGIFLRKRTDPNADNTSTLTGVFSQSPSPYMEIRMAEVVLNVAESACGNGDDATALTYLKKIRERLGYTGDCGLGNPAGDALMSAILYERQIELAYEGKRFEDMRRWLLWDDSYGTCTRLGVEPISGNGTRRHGIILAVNPDVYTSNSAGMNSDPFNPEGKSFNGTDRTQISLNPDASDADWNTQMTALDNFYNTNLMRVQNDQIDGTGTPRFEITHLNKYYFLGIKTNVLQVSTKLEQNIGWDDYHANPGTFNPIGTGNVLP